ncbi:OmpA family protein [Parendozoicomonas sp. Alg238-R29]|uniref:OmpA family protein n=1 Tax=Parendozoicomonas sp. Alg238-R29 TaxID=2993446 RepID=UPI00248F085C|nr:OmpA family protein [Parendozoicomonas sp. Alg238-R29]
MQAAVTYSARFRLPIDDYNWDFERVGGLACRLSRHIEGFGEISMVTGAGLVSTLVLNTLSVRNFDGTVRFFMKPEVWNHKDHEVELGVEHRESDQGMQFTLDVHPLKWITMMCRPYQLLLEIYDKDQQRIAALEIPTTGFSFQLTNMTDCLVDLLPYNFDQLKKTVLYFEPGRAQLTDSQRLKLADIAEYLEWDGSVVGMSIDAYTDSSGYRLDNLLLSEKRGNSVYRYFIAKGVKPTQVLDLRHHGQRYPAENNVTRKGRELNRRVEINLKRSDQLGSSLSFSMQGL